MASSAARAVFSLRQVRLQPISLRPQAALLTRTYASSKQPVTDKSRILEKPTRFNPPSHGSRRTRPRQYPGPRLSEHEREEQKTKRYPNMMPPEGSLLHYFLTNKTIHLWITLSTLVALCIYTLTLSFLSSTSLRHLLPSSGDWLSHPFQSMRQFVRVYKEHVQIESEKVAEKRRQKLADVEKRKEFMRAHGVEPGFLTGGWMDKFGTVEGDQARKVLQQERDSTQGIDDQSPIAASPEAGGLPSDQQIENKPKRKPKYWLGIW